MKGREPSTGSLTLPTETKDPPRGKDKGANVTNQETFPDTQGPIKDRQPITDSLTLPNETQDPPPGKDKCATVSSHKIAPDTLENMDMDKTLLDLVTADTRDPVSVRPVTLKDNQKTQRFSQGQSRNGPGPVKGDNMAVRMAVMTTRGLTSTRYPPKNSLILPTDSLNPVAGGDKDPTMSRHVMALDMQDPTMVRQLMVGTLRQDLTTSNQPLGHMALGNHSLGMDNCHLNSAQ